MSITGLNLVSATPRKSGKISVFLEVEDTYDNIRAFSGLYRKKLFLAEEPLSLPEVPQDRFDLLVEIRSRCQQIRDMITNVLEPPLPSSIASLDISGLADLGVADGAEPLMAADVKVNPLPTDSDNQGIIPSSEKRYIRRCVLNMPMDMWDKMPPGDYVGTAENFLGTIGLPGGLSALFNSDEKIFFEEIYEIYRLSRYAEEHAKKDYETIAGLGGEWTQIADEEPVGDPQASDS